MRRIAILCLLCAPVASAAGCASPDVRPIHLGLAASVETPTVEWNPTVHITLEIKQ